MTDQNSENLLSKNLLSVSLVKTSKSHNKLLRFRYEPEGTKLFVTKDTSGDYHIRKTYDPNARCITVRKNTNPVFLYCNVMQLISEEGYMSLFKDGEDYLERSSTDKEILRYSRKPIVTGTVYMKGNLNGIRLKKEDRKKVYADKYILMHCVTDKKCYIEGRAISDPGKALTLVEAASPYGGWEFLGNAKEYMYYREKPVVETILPIPISFLRKTGMHHGERMGFYFRKDGSFVIEPKPLICDICGKEINRYTENAYEKHISLEHKKHLPVIRKVKNADVSYQEASTLLKDIKKDLQNLL